MAANVPRPLVTGCMSALDAPSPPAPLLPERIAAIVLAGGEARRMGGGDKPLLSVGRQTMLAAVIKALDIPHTAISANGDPSRFAAFGLPVLPDGAFHGQGPLAGVLVGLQWAAALGMTALLTAPGDTPFLPRGLAAMLSPPPRAVRSGGRTHHLVALWPVSCSDRLTTFLRAPGSRRVRDFASEIGMRTMDFPARPADPFANINTPEELAQAREVVSSVGKAPEG